MLYVTSMITIKKISIEYTINDEKRNKKCDTTKKSIKHKDFIVYIRINFNKL